ncbi:MAG: hypothetical protein JSW38_03005 [Dehalococcoidia bacterium]|nr:MAG: hypothetical protein JSW38_03005 [Dehalococcoidia bacterium]
MHVVWLSTISRFRIGDFYADTDKKNKDLEILKKAKAEFRDLGMDYWLGKTQEVLARIRL